MTTQAAFFSPYDYAFHEDPYPVYESLRANAPVFHNSELGLWALSRHADIAEAFRDDSTFSAALGVSPDPAAYGKHAYKTMSFLAMDDPRHNQLRRLVNKGFTPRRVTGLSEQITALTERYWGECLDRARAGEVVDFIADFAGKLPMDVISELMGVPEEDRTRLRALADEVMHRDEDVFDVPETAMTASLELIVYYQGLVAERRAEPKDDLTSALIAAEVDGDKLSDDEIISFLFLMVIAGNETTTKLLGNALYWADRNPDVKAKVFADPDRVEDWVNETLRFDTSSQMVLRTTSSEVEVAGERIPEGEKVLLLIGSANRDAEVFDRPAEYDIDRGSWDGLMSFGVGTHFCLGAHMARLEAHISLRAILSTLEDFSLDGGEVRVHSSNVRGFSSLPMRLVPKMEA
ncbi:cytochrome P450 [Dietzia sp.]|uniref:cytochrome P450 n=1 Tax=Dietzia sp. TaxID=1871616 RepID=UPI002FDAAD5A